MRSQVSAADVVVDDQAFAFLQLQKGRLADLAHDRAAWLDAYRQTLDRDYALIRPHLPPAPTGHALKLLDVGSGLGGINILLGRHYAEAGGAVQVILLDGVADQPQMRLHRETFNDMAAAEQFHRLNGAGPIGWVDPKAPLPSIGWPFDLVVSFGSWCFHYPPAVYLDWVQRSIRPGATLILDVRKAQPFWAAQLISAFSLKAIIHIGEKIDRMVLRAAD